MDITVQIPLFENNQNREDEPNMKRMAFISRDYSNAIALWKQINTLFIEHFPMSGASAVIKSEDSRFDSTEAHAVIRKLQQVSPTQWNDTERSEFKGSIEVIRGCRKSAPYGYCQFLQSVGLISEKLDELVAKHTDFWCRLPVGYWSDGAEVYNKAIKFVDFITSLEPILNQSVEDIYKSAGRSVAGKSLTIKCGNHTARTDAFWKDMIIEGILNEANRWFEEAGIPIDAWDMYSAEAKKIIHEIKKDKVKMDGENAKAYIVGNMIEILEWPAATNGNSNVESAEFIMRFLKICGLDDDNRIDRLDRFHQEAEKDSNGRPLNKSAYYGERREISECIRRLNIIYKSLSKSSD